jgi:hypothetical protein
MKAILIDVNNEAISEIELSNDYTEIYKHLKCDTFTCVVPEGISDAIYVDDEGLLKVDLLTKFFLYNGYPQPLAGNGLILGTDMETGESISTSLSISEVQNNVKFLDIIEVMAINQK